MFMFYAKSTINGPNNIPNTLIDWIKAAAIDWISTVKDSVWAHAKSVYAAATIKKNILEATRETPMTKEVSIKLCLIEGIKKVIPRAATMQ